MKLVAAAIVALAFPASAWGEATLVSRDLPIGGMRSLAATPAPERFNMLGLHWRGSGRVFFRVRGERGWSGWHEADAEAEDLPDRGSDEARRLRTWRIGNPWWTGTAERVQLHLEAVSTESAPTSSGARRRRCSSARSSWPGRRRSSCARPGARTSESVATIPITPRHWRPRSCTTPPARRRQARRSRRRSCAGSRRTTCSETAGTTSATTFSSTASARCSRGGTAGSSATSSARTHRASTRAPWASR